MKNKVRYFVYYSASRPELIYKVNKDSVRYRYVKTDDKIDPLWYPSCLYDNLQAILYKISHKKSSISEVIEVNEEELALLL